MTKKHIHNEMIGASICIIIALILLLMGLGCDGTKKQCIDGIQYFFSSQGQLYLDLNKDNKTISCEENIECTDGIQYKNSQLITDKEGRFIPCYETKKIRGLH